MIKDDKKHDINQDIKHSQKMKKLKDIVDTGIKKATIEKGTIILITGNGKGKSTSAFGTLARALGHKQKTAVVQFLKGEFVTGEFLFFSENENCDYNAIGDGFTWDTQNKEKDIETANKAYLKTKEFLTNSNIGLVVLDEITYMFKYNYLDTDEFIKLLNNRPKMQTVIITGRGANEKLMEVSDTVSIINDKKHAFRNGIKAKKGVDW